MNIRLIEFSLDFVVIFEKERKGEKGREKERRREKKREKKREIEKKGEKKREIEKKGEKKREKREKRKNIPQNLSSPQHIQQFHQI